MIKPYNRWYLSAIFTDLHEESSDKCLANVDVVVFGGELCGSAFEVEPVHDSRQLLSHVVSGLKGTVVDKVIVTPLRVFSI